MQCGRISAVCRPVLCYSVPVGKKQTTISCYSEKSKLLSVLSVLAGRADSGYEHPAVRDVAAKLRTFAHELNNPLAVMMGFTQLIMLNAQCSGKVRADMEKLFSELKRVIHVVERLHGYAISLQESEQPEMMLKSAGA